MASSTISSWSSSPVTSPWLYDVFLSFRGEDTRDTYTAHLYRALTQKGILTYLDEEELRRCDEISPSLFQAIEGSRIFIIVLSENYASSTWCLDELLKIFECKKSKQQIVLPVFYHVDPSDIRHQRGSFGKALAKHAEKLNGDSVKLRMWKDALREVANLSGYHLMRNGRNESKFIKKIVQDVSRMANDHIYLHVAEHPVGLKPRVEDVNLLLSIGTNDIRMIGIFGVGGIGKTTLAKAIYKSIAFRFEASCFLSIDSDTGNQVNRLVQLQETLLFKILGECRSLKVDNIDTGINMINRRLRSKRVLLILDGVDHLDQLKTLAGARDWFGKGSRIIITTRDQHLLTTHDGVDSTYEMTELNHDDAVELFCWHAFKREKPVDGYGEFVEQIVNYAQRLPLALTVLGSDLYGRSESEWESALDQYRKIPHQDIQKILQTSYDRLSENEKNVFLDIACFFNGQVLNDVIKILDIFGFCPNFSIPRLREKCLILEFNQRLQIHHLLRDMGREVVRRESPKIPGARSRLFFHEDVRDVLEEDTGTDRVEAIVAGFPDGADIIRLSPKAFKKMKSLRLFRCWNAHFSGEPNCLPNSIRVLDWPNCPLQSMPSNFRGDKPSILRMPGSRIKEIHLEFKNLTVMNFIRCEFITKLSDISRCPNLKQIYLNFCKNLVEVHDSIGFLDKLDALHLYGCDKLKSFPRLQLRSLQHLNLGGCSRLQIECEMKHLSTVDYFKNLMVLNFGGCDFLTKFSDISRCPNLKEINLRCCENLVEVHDSVGFLDNLVKLNLGECFNLKSFPRRLQLRSLEFLDLSNCLSLQNFPEIECEIKHLHRVLLMGTAIEELPSSIGYLTGLVYLHLSRSVNLKRLPSSIHQLRYLRWINLEDCPNVISIGMEEEVHNGQPTPYVMPTSWENEASLGAELFPLHSTTSLEFVLGNSGLSNSNFFGPFSCFPNLEILDLSGSDIVSIPASIKTFVRLRGFNLYDCKQLQEIMEFPPNLEVLDAVGCISLERLPEISNVFHFPQLKWINLARCYEVTMGNWMLNPAWNRAANMYMIFPGYEIPDWFSHCKEITSNSHQCEFDIKVAPPYNLDDIIGIAFCAVIEPVATIILEFQIKKGVNSSIRHSDTRATFDEIDSDHVWLRYLTTKDITGLRAVSVDQADDLRITFESSDPNSVIFKRCGYHLLYKQHDEQNAKDHENVDAHLDAPIEDIENLANPMDHGSQLSKRRPVDYDDDRNIIESDLYPQRRKPARSSHSLHCSSLSQLSLSPSQLRIKVSA